MSDEAKAKKYLEARGLGDVARVSDPDQNLYRSFELRRARLAEIINPSVLRRGFNAARRGFVNGVVPQGDGLRMGGSFLIHRGKVVKAFCNADVADRPDYCEIARA